MAAAQPFLSGAISQDGQHAARDARPRTSPRRTSKAGSWASRRWPSTATARRKASRCPRAPKATRRPQQAAVPTRAASGCPTRGRSITHKFSVAGHEGYITVGLFDDGRPGELFITMAKEGSTIGGLMDAFGTAVSMSLQYGVPLEDYVSKFSHMRFEPMGYTKNPDIRIAKSLVDYIFRWLGITFLPGYKEASHGRARRRRRAATIRRRPRRRSRRPPPRRPAGGGQRSGQVHKAATAGRGKAAAPRPKPATAKADARPPPTLAPSRQPPANTNGHANGHANGHGNGHANGNGHGEISAELLARAGVMPKDAGPNTARSEQFADFQSDAPACDNCGAITVRNGNCYLCHNCGSSMGCS